MSPPPASIERALARLRSALGALETAVAVHGETARSHRTLETELTLMQDDRARLAVELDGALAHAHRLEAAFEEVSKRVERAMLSVRAVLEEGVMENAKG